MKKLTNEQEIVSIDGKTVRGSKREDKDSIHMVSVWANEAQLVLGQIATAEKSNEITVVPAFLRMLDIEGAIVTADAMNCQREIVKVATERKAEYVVDLKENQLIAIIKNINNIQRKRTSEGYPTERQGQEHTE